MCVLLDNLAEIQRRTGDLEKSVATATRAVSIGEKHLHPTSTYLAEARLTRAQALHGLGRDAEADVEFDRALDLVSDTHREGGVRRLKDTLRIYAAFLRESGRPMPAAQAEARLRALP